MLRSRVVAEIDPRLSVRVISERALHYTERGAADDDRPEHARAASGLAFEGDRLVVVQDDAAFLAVVTRDGVSAVALPRGADGRRRFEIALGNKTEKLDLESCVAIDGELWAFGSGSSAKRERICRIRDGVPAIVDAPELYRALREAQGGALNIEGVTYVAPDLWLFHRGNAGQGDLGPAILVVAHAELCGSLDGGVVPTVRSIRRCDLGSIDSVPFGFTDACAAGDRVFYLAAAEASPNAIDDGAVLGSQLGVIAKDTLRAAPLTGRDGAPIKAEGLALDPKRPNRAFVAIDPDDTERPAMLYEVELIGPW